MRKSTFFLLMFSFLFSAVQAQVTLKGLLTDNLVNPIGIDNPLPRFTWQLISTQHNCFQTSYEISVRQGNKIVWASGRQTSNQSVLVPYSNHAIPLETAEKYTWQVRVTDNTGKTSAWSEPAYFRMGLLKVSDWKAKWIVPSYVEDTLLRPSPMFRKEFVSKKKLLSATAFITAHGLYEAHINGVKVGDAVLTPGWTSYHKRLQYQVYDVTNLVKNGTNAIGVVLGSGWYRGHLAWKNQLNVYGKDIALLMQIKIDYSDGTSETIVSDESWKSTTGAIRYSEIYNGETIDARLEKNGWDNV